VTSTPPTPAPPDPASAPATPATTGPGRRLDDRWLSVVAGGVWLVYLGPAAVKVATEDAWSPLTRALAGGSLVAFVALYLTTLFVAVPARRARSIRQDGYAGPADAAGDREMALRTGGLLVLGLGGAVAFGTEWMASMAYVSPVMAIVLDRRWVPRAIVAVLVLAELMLLALGETEGSGFFWVGFAILLAGFLTYASRRQGELEGALLRAEERNARLAVVDERNRIARDLHDLLGHSLSVIAVKAQLAERLLERERPADAMAEIRDVRGVARDALHEVRHVVDGYRRRPLAAVVASARAALEAGGVQVRTALPARPVPQDAEDVVAFVVREGSTNVLRHAGARTCTIAVRRDPDAVVATVTDDGAGAGQPRVLRPDDRRPGDGHGLAGLAERVTAVGGRVELRAGPAGGTILEAHIPLAEEADPAGTVGATTVGSGPAGAPERPGVAGAPHAEGATRREEPAA
jgi:two-component system sensor histidine kinase DesK